MRWSEIIDPVELEWFGDLNARSGGRNQHFVALVSSNSFQIVIDVESIRWENWIADPMVVVAAVAVAADFSTQLRYFIFIRKRMEEEWPLTTQSATHWAAEGEIQK